MNLDDLTIGQVKQISAMLNNKTELNGLNDYLMGEYVIIRTYSAGVWFGLLSEKSGNEVILKNARRMWSWKAAKSISLSGIALYGINDSGSKIVTAIESVWLEAIEILKCTEVAISSLKGAKDVEAQ